jgi:N6-adenosine-specific RNA methylase IME4
LLKAELPEDAIKVGAGVAGIEEMMRRSGLYRGIEEFRPVRELFLDSRWTLGRLLKKVVREPHGRPKNKTVRGVPFSEQIKRLGLSKPRVVQCQRVGTLPVAEKARAYGEAKKQEILPTIELLIDVARPYWYQASRQQRHRDIADAAKVLAVENLGPFPLLYADPPWKFSTYSEKGLDRTPDQHYPTLTYEEIANFRIGDRLITQIAAENAALLLWCTSSNVDQALGIVQAWGFEFKSSAVWIKTKADGSAWTGLGLVFRNAHELLLYGTRGTMPGPQYQPPSVFQFPRGRHSEKPAEIRKEIEKMYPDFDNHTRVEIFARDEIQGWTVHGNEAYSRAAAE